MRKKKVLAMLMALTLAASMCPLTAVAANIPAVVETENSEAADTESQETAVTQEKSNTEESGKALTEENLAEGNVDTEESGEAQTDENPAEENVDTEESGKAQTDEFQEEMNMDANTEKNDALLEEELTTEEKSAIKEFKDILNEEETNAAAEVQVKSENLETAGANALSGSGFVLMNITYDEFYKQELDNNSVKVDTFTSATLNKSRTKNLVNGSYHKDAEGKYVNGVTVPVYVSDLSALSGLTQVTDSSSVTIKVTNRGTTTTTTFKGKDALFESDDHSFYYLGAALPAEYKYYKAATISGSTFTFGKLVNNAGTAGTGTEIKTQTVAPGKYEFTTDTSYGEYQLNIPGIVKDNGGPVDDENDLIYGVVVTVKDDAGAETDYGMRHMENIWLGYELSWCTGFTKSIHGCPTDSEHYASMMGKTITKVTYYTNKGVYEIPFAAGIKVPVQCSAELMKGTGNTASLSLKDASGRAVSDYKAVAAESQDLGKITVSGSTISWTKENVLPGIYNIQLTDSNGKYASKTADLLLSTDTTAADYDAEKGKLVAAGGSSAANLANFIKNITEVKVGANNYSVSGRGAVKVINADGSINWDVKNQNKAVFENGKEYTFVVSASGYPDLTFTATKAEIQKNWVSSVATQVYTGAAIIPKVTVKNGNQTLTNNVDYKLTCKNNINAGTATITVTGIGKYSGTVTLTFAINQADSKITLGNKTVTYNGQAVVMSGANVTGSKGKVTYSYYSDKNCTKAVTAANVKNAGIYYVKANVAADNNYKAATSAVATLTINKAASAVTLANKTVTATGKKTAMTGAKVTGSKGKVSYKYYSDKNCKKAVSAAKVKTAGTYYVKATVAADTNYRTATSKVAKLVIKPAQKLTCKKTTVTYRASELKSAKKTFKIGAASKQKGKITYTKATNAKKTLSVDRNGKVTVKKGLKKGTYTLNVKITAAAKGTYGKTIVTKTIKVKVK